MDMLLFGKLLTDEIKTACPYKTGNLRSTIKSYVNADGKFVIEVGGPQAEYMVYTNEQWVSPKWNGKKNPNEHWWENIVKKVMKLHRAENIAVRFTRSE